MLRGEAVFGYDAITGSRSAETIHSDKDALIADKLPPAERSTHFNADPFRQIRREYFIPVSLRLLVEQIP